jgi:hypothetical protein
MCAASGEAIMSVTSKLGPKAEAIIGEPVEAVAIVVPPGATLYKSFSPKANLAGSLFGPIMDAATSKSKTADQNMAGSVPRQQGMIALTASKVIYLKKKTFGTAPASVLTEWSRSDVTFTFESNGKWSYPGLALQFADGSARALFGEKRFGLEEFAAAAN